MRLFFAVPLPSEIRRKIAAQFQPGSCPRSLRRVKPANLHFTLRFLGEVAPERIGELTAAGEETVARHHPFSLTIGGCGFFPERGEPRVFWLGVARGARQLVALESDLAATLQEKGLLPAGEDKPFQPHLTVARLKGKLSAKEREDLLARGDHREFGRFSATRLDLVQSDLTPDGPVYTVRHGFELAEKPLSPPGRKGIPKIPSPHRGRGKG